MRTQFISAKMPFAVGLSLLITASLAHAAPVTSAAIGKKSIFAAEHSGLTSVQQIVPLAGDFAKAAKGVLAIEAQITFLSDATNGTTGVYQQMAVTADPSGGNDLLDNFTHPFFAPGPQVNCGTGGGWCTITATYWVDLDAAEAALPGMVIGKPLRVELRGGALAGPNAVNYRASFSARFQKK